MRICVASVGRSREVVLVFFFQAEDGIRDADVTGVQTCALPISSLCLIMPCLASPVPLARRASMSSSRTSAHRVRRLRLLHAHEQARIDQVLSGAEDRKSVV